MCRSRKKGSIDYSALQQKSKKNQIAVYEAEPEAPISPKKGQTTYEFPTLPASARR
jgi:hypothetical protein